MEIFVLLIVLVVLFIVTHFVAAYAEGKGRSYGGFFLLTFLCFPLGLIAAVLASPNQVNIAVASNLVKCEFCAEYIKQEAKICKHCGKEVTVKPIGNTYKHLDNSKDWDKSKYLDNSGVKEYEGAESLTLILLAAIFGVGLTLFLIFS